MHNGCHDAWNIHWILLLFLKMNGLGGNIERSLISETLVGVEKNYVRFMKSYSL